MNPRHRPLCRRRSPVAVCPLRHRHVPPRRCPSPSPVSPLHPATPWPLPRAASYWPPAPSRPQPSSARNSAVTGIFSTKGITIPSRTPPYPPMRFTDKPAPPGPYGLMDIL